MWSLVMFKEGESCPCSRSKHSVTLLGNYLYILAGRNGNVPLKDFWRLNLGRNEWELLKPDGDCPPSLQEHTAVTFRDNIYVFGGELGFSGGIETPLWIYESKKNVWRKIKGQKGASVPKGRRGHTTLIHRGSALIYGGYCDLRGSSSELWIFHFDTESWHLLMNGKSGPPARHKHSSVLHDDSMWIYGGMTDLQERSDLWRFDIMTQKWFAVKCKFNPGPLHSHAACKLPTSMLLLGGERNGEIVNELWRFHFGTETWQRIHTDVISPQPFSECCAITIPEWLLEDINIAKHRQLTSSSTARKEQHSSHNTSHNSFGVSRFSDLSTPRQCVMVPPRRQATTPNSCNLNFLKEISKLSQMNLSRLTQNGRCSYHALGSNESIHNVDETSNEEMSRLLKDNFNTRAKPGCASGTVWRDVSSLVNTPLTPSDATKLVYLEGEEAPVITAADDFSTVHQRLHPSQNRNRRSYPLANNVRFADPLITPEKSSPDITSDYASCENIHKLLSSHSKSNGTGGDKVKTPNRDYSITSFSNPNYFTLVQQQQTLSHVEEKICRGDYVKLNSPADSLLEDSATSNNKYEMTELRPIPPKSLPLSCGNDEIVVSENRKKYRACSAGRYDKRQPVTPLCVFLVGGKDHNQTTTLKRPISIWKLSLTTDIH